jgi:hypothetical protein
MYEVCKTLQPYSKDGMFAVQGFGGIPNYVDANGKLKTEEVLQLDEEKAANLNYTPKHEIETQKRSFIVDATRKNGCSFTLAKAPLTQ